MSMAIDETIARDLAALAGDARRGWRSVDAALAPLTPALESKRRLEDTSPLTTIAQVFARRVAAVAGGGAVLAMMTVILVSAFAPSVDSEFKGAFGIEHGIADGLGWVLVPGLAIYAFARELAARWIVAALATSATPLADGQRWLRTLDAAATALAIAALTIPVLFFGLLYFVFGRQLWSSQWYLELSDSTTRRERLLPFVYASGAIAVVAAMIASRPRRVRWLTHIAWIPLGVLGLALAVYAGRELACWPFEVWRDGWMDPPLRSPLAVRVVFTIAGSASALAIAAALVLRSRARDERRLASPMAGPDAAALVGVQRAVSQPAAWLGAGLGLVAGVVALLLGLGARFLGDHAWSFPGSLHWPRFEMVYRLLFDFFTSVPCLVTFAIATHAGGALLGEHLVNRVVARVSGDERRTVLAQLAEQLTGWAIAAMATGVAALVVAYAMLRLAYDSFIETFGLYVSSARLDKLMLLYVASAVVMAGVLGVMVARLHRRRSRVLCVLRHYVTPASSVLVLVALIKLSWHADFSTVGRYTPCLVFSAAELPVLRPLGTLGLALATFLLAAWAGLSLARRPRSTPPHAASLE